MKVIALFSLIVILTLSLFSTAGAQVTNNTVAVALMILLLALFSDLKEFNFWGISGKKKEVVVKKIDKDTVINDEIDLKPSVYKLRKANREDNPGQMESLHENFLSLSYDIERQLRIIARSIARSTEETAQLSPEAVLQLLEDVELLTPEAGEAIESIRQVRETLVTGTAAVNSDTLEKIFKVSKVIHEQLRNWLDQVSK